MGEKRDPEQGEAFQVKDRRRFSADGEARQAEPEADAPAAQRPPADEPAGDRTQDQRNLPEIDFSTFIISLSSSAMMHLGYEEHPDGGKHKDLELARQTIDMLAILKEKTAGNLSEAESRLMDELLYNLRMTYLIAIR